MSRSLRNAVLCFSLIIPGSLVVPVSAQVDYTANATISTDLGPNSAIVGSAGTSPTVNLVNGGLVETGYYLESDNASTVNINGGTVSSNLFAYNTSTVNLNSGSVGFILFAENNSVVNVTGGSVGFELYTEDSSTANISGGSIDWLGVNGNSAANISGGSINTIRPGDNSTVNISGGTIADIVYGFDNATVNITGGNFGELDLYGNSVFNLFGTGLSDVLINPDEYGSYEQYALSGTLEDGTDLTGKYLYVVIGTTATFNLHDVTTAVPEPGSFGLLIGLGMSGVQLYRRRKVRK